MKRMKAGGIAIKSARTMKKSLSLREMFFLSRG
jgi:hypothetical protein